MPCPFSILLGSLNDAILIVSTSPVERLVTIQRTTSNPSSSESCSSLMEGVCGGLSSSLIVTLPNLIQNQGFFSLWNGTAARIWANAIASAVAGWCSSKTQSLLSSSPLLNNSNNLQPILMYLGTILPPSLLVYPLLHASVMLSIETPQYAGIDDYFRNVSTFKELYDGFLPMFIGTTQQYLLTSTLQTWWSNYRERRQQQQQTDQKEKPQPPSRKIVDLVEQTVIAMIVGAAAEPWFYTSYQQMVITGGSNAILESSSAADSLSALGVRMIKIAMEQSIQHSDLFDYLRKAILSVASYFH
mmetsp:Transcript_17257/g.41937  ORF Transcript_17257/g.41937 Transcript_17257/m.41937 type:complete len:301 (-) Transcript_17257:453-1355(-)